MSSSRIGKPLKLLLSLCIASFCLGLTSALAAENKCQIAESAISDASSIRGLQIKSKVPCVVQEREDVKKYLLGAVKTKIPPLKLRMEALVFKTLGFLPDDFDYEKGLVDLYLNQIGGYYDPETKRFAMAGWLPGIMQTTIAVHELTHALQDQYFNLKTFTDEKKYSGDELLARSALVEGDATAVMLDYTRKLVGQPSVASDPDVESVMMQNVMGVSMAPGMSDVPPSLQLLLIFPYTSGLRFAHVGLKKGGYAEVNKMFKRAPRSTEEILHPEKYYQSQPDFKLIPEDQFHPSGLPQDLKPIYSDVIGEFATSVLLGNFIKDKFAATKASQGWGGDRVVVFEDLVSRQQVVVWRNNWDTEADAIEFEEVFKKRLDQLKSPRVLSSRLERAGESVEFEVRLPLN